MRDRTERRLARLILAQEQRHRAITEQHRLNRQRGLGALFLELSVSKLVALAEARDFAKTVVLVAKQWRDERRVRFRHQHDRHLARVGRQIPLRNLDCLQHH